MSQGPGLPPHLPSPLWGCPPLWGGWLPPPPCGVVGWAMRWMLSDPNEARNICLCDLCSNNPANIRFLENFMPPHYVS